MPHAEAAAAETLALPIYPELTEDQIRYVASSVREFTDP
jgi:dTDP-4-amino-4,6-dideoxygalactose transaminase